MCCVLNDCHGHSRRGHGSRGRRHVGRVCCDHTLIVFVGRGLRLVVVCDRHVGRVCFDSVGDCVGSVGGCIGSGDGWIGGGGGC